MNCIKNKIEYRVILVLSCLIFWVPNLALAGSPQTINQQIISELNSNTKSLAISAEKIEKSVNPLTTLNENIEKLNKTIENSENDNSIIKSIHVVFIPIVCAIFLSFFSFIAYSLLRIGSQNKTVENGIEQILKFEQSRRDEKDTNEKTLANLLFKIMQSSSLLQTNAFDGWPSSEPMLTFANSFLEEDNKVDS